MAKIRIDKLDSKSLIKFELNSLEEKVKEFQDYLRINKINSTVTQAGVITLSEDDQDKLHKELLIQIKVQDAIFNWVPLLEKLRESQEVKDVETRGDIEINGLYKNKT